MRIDADIAKRLSKPLDEIWIGYCGTLGSSYDLICVFDSLKILKNKGISMYKLIVMGRGPREQEFEEYARNLGINVIFTGNLPYQQMCGLLAACDIAINPITKGAAQSIINKHADYAAAGIPVISTQECEEYRNLVEEYQMGFNCENNNSNDLADKLSILANDRKLIIQMGYNARRCAEEKFNRSDSYGIILYNVEYGQEISIITR